MDADAAIDLLRSALLLAVTLAVPVLLAAFVVAFVTSLLQAVTQIQDVTLGYVPRLLIGGAALLAMLPWMLQRLATYTVDLYDGIARGL